ncbi:MAG: 50S ribosomal protein L1 [Candidatus Scalindua sp.]|jgi:large subunit ribosomal protein L1|nr:50S ribosomal protein L1 [Candidatus Scalindua sp.]MBT5305794.1 50S ribosomal protein L1 [Candidatus Scalindua sp.]MBT6226211.1 50S ribosomal protein L1 [Candidatus Scalindua sp.]MBT6561335.1 50S ribosomal protein L1 [Candidatus Scalindua sp.]MBT7211516.1 50S ribosomal protein L1 [Candidatus Scalindua sp.]
MKARSKRYKESSKIVEQAKEYEVGEAVSIVKAFKKAKFDEAVDIVMKLGVDPKHSDQLVRGSFSLPKGIGKEVRVVVFASGEDKIAMAREAGAVEAGGDDLLAKVEGGWMDFDVAISTPDMMGKVGKLGRVLGPQGKMPSPKSGTVTNDILNTVKEFKEGKIEYRTDAGGNVHVPVGKVSFPDEDLVENINSFIRHIVGNRPPAAKGTFVQKISISSSMGPGVRIALAA